MLKAYVIRLIPSLLRFGEEAVHRMVRFIEDAKEDGTLADDAQVLDVGKSAARRLSR